MKQLLQRPVAFHPALARLFGGINEAIYWQQIYYWSDKGKRDDGFVYKTKGEIEAETTLTRDQQDRARKNLEKQGYLVTKLIKANGAPTLHYKPAIGLVENQLIQSQETHQSEKRETSQSITESTQESTTESTTPASEHSSQEVVAIIDAFKEVNKSFTQWYKNTTQRAACHRLIETYSLELTLKVVTMLRQTNGRPYFPTITTPVQLEQKWSQLEAAWQRYKLETNNPKVIW